MSTNRIANFLLKKATQRENEVEFLLDQTLIDRSTGTQWQLVDNSEDCVRAVETLNGGYQCGKILWNEDLWTATLHTVEDGERFTVNENTTLVAKKGRWHNDGR